MTASKLIQRIITATATLAIAALPVLAAPGSPDFTRYVALGDSYTAGVSSASLVDSHQKWSYPSIIARQANAGDFEQPLVSQPGIGPELELVNLAPTIIPKSSSNGSPENLTLPRPYNNLGIPGAEVHDLLTIDGSTAAVNTPTLFAQFILRGLGTPVQQALALHPTFITVWIGGNDVLGAVLDGTPAVLTPLDQFTADYNTLLDELRAGAPDAGIVTAGIADVTSLPYANTVPPVLVNPATRQPVLGPDGNPIFLVAQLGDGTVGQLTPGALVLLPATAFESTGYGIPAALAPLFPQLPDVGKPLPDAVVLDAAEVAEIQQRAVDVNAAIHTAAAARNIPVVDMQALLNEFKVGVIYGGGISFNTAFLTGGIFGYDGFHPTNTGYMLIANHWIKTINASYGTQIPLASITQLFADNDDVDTAGQSLIYNGMPFQFSLLAWNQLLAVSNLNQAIPTPAPTTRSRGIRH